MKTQEEIRLEEQDEQARHDWEAEHCQKDSPINFLEEQREAQIAFATEPYSFEEKLANGGSMTDAELFRLSRLNE
jgi:hypothetical protein